MRPKRKQEIEIEKTHRNPLTSFHQALTQNWLDFLGTALILHDFLLFDMVWQIKPGGLAGVSGTPIRSVLLMHCRHRGLPGYLVAAAG
jgi:hypothetical protein